MAKARPVQGLNVQAPTEQNAEMIARTRLDELYAWRPHVDRPYAVHELHNMRIAAKRLRYTLEIFEDFLPDECKAMVKEVEQVQEELGALHDSDVLIALLRLCLASQESPVTHRALVSKQKGAKNIKTFLEPELVTELLDPAVAPTAEERYGLEQLVRRQEQVRETQYQTFRQHWYRMLEQDFRRHLLALLNKERVAVS